MRKNEKDWQVWQVLPLFLSHCVLVTISQKKYEALETSKVQTLFVGL